MAKIVILKAAGQVTGIYGSPELDFSTEVISWDNTLTPWQIKIINEIESNELKTIYNECTANNSAKA